MQVLPRLLSWARRSKPRPTVSHPFKIIGGGSVAVGIAMLCGSLAQAQICTVSPQNNEVDSRQVQLDINCAAPFFKLSESPDYQETPQTGVVVTIDSIDPLSEYADVSIQYPNGTTGGNATPFVVSGPEREIRLLAVLFNFSAGALAPPDYATPAWVEKLVFGRGHDGRDLANSIRAHIEQNTYGRVVVSGEVYPSWVEVSSLERYRDLTLTPTPDRLFAEEIVQRLVDTDAGFFDGKDFDFLIAFTPGGLMATTLRGDNMYSNWPDVHGIFEGWAMYDIPIDSNSQLYGTIYNEPRVSTTETIVVPQYNPYAVEGVWLANDINQTGTNYFTGGRVRYDTSNPNRYAHFIELGTALPAANTNVIVTYTARASVRLSDEQMALAVPDTMPESVKFGHHVHELYHGIGWLLNPSQQAIGDLYHNPQQLIEAYGLMSGGAWNNYVENDTRYYVPGNLSAYSKVKLNLVQPYTLVYGNNATGLRLHKAAEGDFTDTNDRIKVIKVPLHPTGDVGYQQLVEYPFLPDDDVTFGGEAYLLLEWRSTGRELENGAYNFDEALPHAGLVIYRVIEGDPASMHGDQNTTLIRIADATPAFSAFPFDSLQDFWAEDVFSLDTSAATFGDASRVYTYVAAAPWNWKANSRTTAHFQLSPGNDPKTIYAKFMDLNGQIVSQTSASVTLSEPVNMLPVANAGSDQSLTDEDSSGAEAVTLDGSQSFDPDGTLASYAWYGASGLLGTGMTPVITLPIGVHTITLTVFDEQGASDSNGVQVTVLAANQPPVAEAGVDVTITDMDLDGIETVILDGTASSDADGSIVAYHWYESGTLISSSAIDTASLAVGTHSITLSVTDDRGASSTDVRAVEVLAGRLAVPTDLSATVVGDGVTLTWVDAADNEAGFYVERGKKSKNALQFSRVAAVGPDATMYAESLASGTYFYRVQAFGANGVQSDYSNIVEIQIKGGGKRR